MANSVDPDQTVPIGTVCFGSTLFASILNYSVILCKYLQQTTAADDICRCFFFLGALRVNFLCLYWLQEGTARTASVSADSFKMVTLTATSFLEKLKHEKQII